MLTHFCDVIQGVEDASISLVLLFVFGRSNDDLFTYPHWSIHFDITLFISIPGNNAGSGERDRAPRIILP